MQTYEQHSSTKLASIVIAVIVIAGVVLVADHLKREASENTVPQHIVVSSSPASSASSSTSPGSSSSSGYKDGTYNASASYYVPHGNEQITVNVTLQSGTITDVSIQNSEGDRDSAQYQEDFASVYKSYVVGKKISGLSLSTVAGASDTTDGFNAAIARISSQAHA